MTPIKATVHQASGFSDIPARVDHVTVVDFVNASTPDASRRTGYIEGIHGICITGSGRFEAYPLHQLRKAES